METKIGNRVIEIQTSFWVMGLTIFELWVMETTPYVAYIPEKESSYHVVQRGKFFFFLKMWLNLVNDTKLPTYPKKDQVIT